MSAPRTSTDWPTLRELFSKDKAQRGFELDLARKASKLGWLLGAAVGFGLMPFYPPTAAIGTAGWVVIGVLSLATGIWMNLLFLRPERVTRNMLLVTAYLGLVNAAAVQWLAGGLPAPYHELYPFMICTAAAAHTAVRFSVFLFVMLATAVIPELGHASAAQIGDLVTELVLWTGAAIYILGVFFNLRQSREDSLESEARANELARVDPLTGLGNRRAFEESMVTEVARARRNGSALSLVMFDLDRFKEINDVYGHLAGDNCLQQVAGRLRDELRGGDVCYRWGGDEFVALLFDAGEASTVEAARRMDGVVATTCARPDGTPLRVTSGHATLTDSMTGDDLVAAADRTLLERKDRVSAPPASLPRPRRSPRHSAPL